MKLYFIRRGVSLDNFDATKVRRRWYFEVTLWRGYTWFSYSKLPVSGGSCAGLHIGYLHICWGGWRAINW